MNSSYSPNDLEMKANQLKTERSYSEALRIFLFMADGDNSLDAGYLGIKLAECYAGLGDSYSAKYWYGRALEENPEVYKDYRKYYDELDYLIAGFFD